MYDRRFGKLLKKIRIGKHMTQEYVAQGIITTKYLSRLENGEHEISARVLYELLDRLNITHEEWQVLLNMEDSMEAYFLKMKDAIQKGDRRQLSSIVEQEKMNYQQDGNVCHRHFQKLIEGYLQKQNPIKVKTGVLREIVRYLEDVQEYGAYELHLLTILIPLLSAEKAHHLVMLAARRLELYGNVLPYKKQLSIIMLGLLEKDLENHRMESARDLSWKLQKLLEGTQFHNELLRYRFLSALVEVRNSHKSDSIPICTECIHLLRFLGDHQQAEEYEILLEKYRP